MYIVKIDLQIDFDNKVVTLSGTKHASITAELIDIKGFWEKCMQIQHGKNVILQATYNVIGVLPGLQAKCPYIAMMDSFKYWLYKMQKISMTITPSECVCLIRGQNLAIELHL